MSRDGRIDADRRRARASPRRSGRERADRAQSNVIGVALLLGVVVISLGTLTAGVGTVVEENAASADATRVATDLDAALAPVEATGVRRGRVSFTEGRLETVERELRVLNESGVRRTVGVDALAFTAGDRRVVWLAGAVVRGTDDNARLRTPPPITASRADGDGDADRGVLVVGAPALNGSATVAATDGASVALRTDVSHRRERLGNGSYRVAIETATPDAWRRHFAERNATATTRDFDGDGIPSVVARYPGERVAYLVVHDLRLEVADG